MDTYINYILLDDMDLFEYKGLLSDFWFRDLCIQLKKNTIGAVLLIICYNC